MSKGHHFEICRSTYKYARESGSPSVNIADLGNDGFCAETSDGLILNEQVTGCCKWAMKSDTAREWLEA